MKKLIFLLLLLPVIAFAQSDWEYILSTNSDDHYYIRDAVKLDDYGRLSVWVKIHKSDNKEFFKGQKYYRPSDRVLTKWDMDCQNRTTKTQTMVVYDVKGKVRHSSNGPFEESYVIPDSVAEQILYVSCTKFNK